MRHSEHSFPYATKHAETAGGSIAYFDEGPSDDARGKGARPDPLLFVHGLGGDFTHFEHIAPPFVKSHRILGIDLPGCGESSKPVKPRHTTVSYGRAILDLMTHLKIPKVTLVGHSAGGLVCAQAALMAPERISRLVLINTAGLRYYSRVMRLAARAVMRPRLLAAILKPAAPLILNRVFSTKNAFTEKFASDVLHPSRMPHLVHVCRVFHDLIPDLMIPTVSTRGRDLTMPALVIWGDRDRLVPLETVRTAAKGMASGTLEVIPGAGHMPMIEQPAATVELMQAFFAQTQLAPKASAA